MCDNSLFHEENQTYLLVVCQDTPHINFRAITLVFDEHDWSFLASYSHTMSVGMPGDMEYDHITENYIL
jgi:hypothetical protein